MGSIIEYDIRKLTKDYLLADSIKEIDRIKTIIIPILNIKNQFK